MGFRAPLCHLPGLGKVGHSPRGTSGSTGTLDWGPIWLGSLSSCIHLTNPQADRLIFCHMAGWLANWSCQAGWLADCLSNKMSTLPFSQAETSCGHVCDNLGHIDQMYHFPSRDISWPSLVLLWAGCPSVRCTPSSQHETAGQVCIWSDVKSGHLNIMSDVPPNRKSHLDMERWLPPHGRLLHHERPFTREGNYLVNGFSATKKNKSTVYKIWLKDKEVLPLSLCYRHDVTDTLLEFPSSF